MIRGIRRFSEVEITVEVSKPIDLYEHPTHVLRLPDEITGETHADLVLPRGAVDVDMNLVISSSRDPSRLQVQNIALRKVNVGFFNQIVGQITIAEEAGCRDESANDGVEQNRIFALLAVSLMVEAALEDNRKLAP